MCLLKDTVHNRELSNLSPLSLSWTLSPRCSKSSPRAKPIAKYKFSLSSWQLDWLCRETFRKAAWEVVHLLFLEFWVSQLYQNRYCFCPGCVQTSTAASCMLWSDDYIKKKKMKGIEDVWLWRNCDRLEYQQISSLYSPSSLSENWASALFVQLFILRPWTTLT